MTDEPAAPGDRPIWVDLASHDPEGSRAFYGRVFGWDLDVSPDPQYGGYAVAHLDGGHVAGIGGVMSPDAPTAWSIYIGTPDASALGDKVTAAGGTVVVPAFDVGDQGRMAVFRDPSGAFISAWQAGAMPGFDASGPNTFGWAELSARGLEQALPFYEAVFGWATRTSPMGEGRPPYTEFLRDGESVAGAMEMNPQAPAGMPSYWLAYFSVADVDTTHQAALEAGADAMLPPTDFPGGRFAVLSDPQGAAFGLLRTRPR